MLPLVPEAGLIYIQQKTAMDHSLPDICVLSEVFFPAGLQDCLKGKAAVPNLRVPESSLHLEPRPASLPGGKLRP